MLRRNSKLSPQGVQRLGYVGISFASLRARRKRAVVTSGRRVGLGQAPVRPIIATKQARGAGRRVARTARLHDLQHDLAEVGVALHVAVSFGHLVEREDAIDDGPEAPLVEERQHVTLELVGDPRLLRGRAHP